MDSGQTDSKGAFVTNLVGRQEALARLAASLRPPYEGPLVVVIEGPAGIGKTSLLWAALTQAETLGVTTLRASPVDAEVSFAYATLRDLLSAALPGAHGARAARPAGDHSASFRARARCAGRGARRSRRNERTERDRAASGDRCSCLAAGVGPARADHHRNRRCGVGRPGKPRSVELRAAPDLRSTDKDRGYPAK